MGFTIWGNFSPICESEISLSKLTILATFCQPYLCKLSHHLRSLHISSYERIWRFWRLFASRIMQITSSGTVLTCWQNYLNFVNICFPRYDWMLLGPPAKEKAVCISLVVKACYLRKTESNVYISLVKACLPKETESNRRKAKQYVFSSF